ncbi:UDP-N-acetylmuramate dehydrogenase, partial [bacterium]|nr:UDP-N-acetylmuramate dehydrogenase [bacterium]
SNVLVSDDGYTGIVIVNKARKVLFEINGEAVSVLAESGANLGATARQAAIKGFSGLEWATTIPGTVGGAVYGNAGAYGSDIKNCLILAEILHPDRGVEEWSSSQMAYDYRSSALKRSTEKSVILSARLRLSRGNPEEIKSLMDEYTQHRQRTQPPGASLGSMFKNPPGDYAGRLIEGAGLKGFRIGGAQVSTVHANFFVNDEGASAMDIWRLIQKVRTTVFERFGVTLALEIEMLGNWPADSKRFYGERNER